MPPPAQERSAIQALARRLAALDPKTDVLTDLLGLMGGALYALDRAAELGFDDARATPDRDQFAAEFRETLRAIGAGTAAPMPWRAGFYYVSALLRLHALDERIAHVPTDKGRWGTPRSAEEKVCQEVARRAHAELAGKLKVVVELLKHEPAAHMGRSWPFLFGDAVQFATGLCDLLEQRFPAEA
jgi:hypothetical protein